MDSKRKELIDALAKQVDMDLHRMREEEAKALESDREDFISIAKMLDDVLRFRAALQDYSLTMKIFDYQYGR